MPMMPISRSTASGNSFSLKLRWNGSAALRASNTQSNGKRSMASIRYIGVGVTRNAESAHDALIARLDECLDGSAFGKGLLHLLRPRQRVHLPEIDVVGLEQLERALQKLQGSVPCAVVGLGGEKGLRAPGLHDLAEVLLAPSVFDTTVARRRVHVVDAEIERTLDQRHRDIEVVGLFDRRLAAETEDSRPGTRSCRGFGSASRPVCWD